jgi:hypothetical protein
MLDSTHAPYFRVQNFNINRDAEDIDNLFFLKSQQADSAIDLKSEKNHFTSSSVKGSE